MLNMYRVSLLPIVVCIAPILWGCTRTSKPGEMSDNNGEPIGDVRLILERGEALGEMPNGLVVRISGCMGAADDESQGVVERWEITPGEVHRVERQFKDGEPIYHRTESRKCDSANICSELLKGGAIAIDARKGTGPETVLAGTIFRTGSRSIELEWNDKTILDLHETNGATFDAYKQTDAEAFGQLYETLASHARIAFFGQGHAASKLSQ